MATDSESTVGLAPGFVVDGRYRVVRVLDLGGTGVVHQVEHVVTGRRLALKTLIDPSNEARLEQEARAASHLRNSHVIRIVDMGKAPQVGPYLVMELLEGTSLRALIDEAGQLPIDLVANVALQVCECLDEAHGAGIVHRDLKPGNIHLAPTFGAHYHVTVLDFGAVKLQGPEIRSQISPQEDLTRVGSTVGTPFYMSLEQLRGNASVDAVSDVYSLSVVLYEMLAGTRPFQADSLGDLVFALVQTPPPPLSSIRPDLPPDLAALIGRGLSSNRDDRPASAREVARALAPLGDGAYGLWLKTAPARAGISAVPAVPAPAVARATPVGAPAAGSAPQVAPKHGAPAPAAPAHGLPPQLAPQLAPLAPPPATPAVAPLAVPGTAASSLAPLPSPPPRAAEGAAAPAPPTQEASPVAPPLGPPRPPGTPPSPPRPPATGLPGLKLPPPPAPSGPGLRPPPSPLVAGPLAGAPARTAAPRPLPPTSGSGEHSALTAIPAAFRREEAPTPKPEALPTTPAVSEARPEAELAPQGLPDLFDPTTSNEPTAERSDPLPPIKRQDTPTEMFVQDAHGIGPVSPVPVARPAAPAAPPSQPKAARPELPKPSADDDNPTSVLDLEALTEASRRKAASLAGPATTPPPPMGAPVIAGPPLGPPLGPSLGPTTGNTPNGALIAGANDTMRLDIESLSGPMAIPVLTTDELAKVGDSVVEQAPEPFEPGRISLATPMSAGPISPHASMPRTGTPPGPPPSSMGPSMTPQAIPPGSSGPASHVPGHLPSHLPEGPVSVPKPAWQENVDRGIASVALESKEASARFGRWFRGLASNEQMAFVAGAVLAFLIVVMLFVLIVT
jgi:hypothetical protein